jgi:hypothetical protein
MLLTLQLILDLRFLRLDVEQILLHLILDLRFLLDVEQILLHLDCIWLLFWDGYRKN